MRCEPIRAEDLPRWVPGTVLSASDGQRWPGVKLRAYRYTALDVAVPALEDFMVVAYRRGPTPMHRRFDGRWRHEHVVPGDVSLLTRATTSHWNWTRGIEVVHVYLASRLVGQVCEEMYDREISAFHFRDVLKAPDPILFHGAVALADEAACHGLGGALYVDAVARQMCVHALRKYSGVSCREAAPAAGLSARQARQLVEYIDEHLDHALTLADLAGTVRVSSRHFLRQFKRRFGTTPHDYVIRKRLACAQSLLAGSDMPIKAIAARAGFTDQAHMTRTFRRYLRTTPRSYRGAVRD